MLACWLAWVAHADDTERFLAWTRTLPATDPVPEVAADYRFVGALFGDIAAAIARHPDVVEVEHIGDTVVGRPIWAFHVRDPGREPERKVLIFGGIHALEWVGVEVAADVLIEAIDAPWPVALTVVPLLNVDGRAKVEDDLLAGRNVFRRGNQPQVDLNRDFAVNTEVRAIWAHVLPAYYGHSDAPLSQPESRAIDTLAARERYDRAASLHAFGGFFYYPWTGRFARPPDEAEFVRLGRRMEQAQGAHAYRTRQLGRWGFFFRAQGSEIDHLYGRYGTHAFLVELTRSGIEPLRPWTWKSYFRWYNPADADPHVERGVRAMRALIETD